MAFTVQWVIIEQGCFTYSMVVVPLYDTLGTDAITYIVNKGTYVFGVTVALGIGLGLVTLHSSVCLERGS